mgnify:CR=1 FL=1|jgi:hypothetical protein
MVKGDTFYGIGEIVNVLYHLYHKFYHLKDVL